MNITNLLVKLVLIAITSVSPEVRKMFEVSVREWHTKAKQSPNKWDDLVVWLMAGVLGVDLEG